MSYHRLYVDESGDHRSCDPIDAGLRYLGITGVLMERRYYQGLRGELEDLKAKHFPWHEQVILVRSSIKSRKGPFEVLRDPQKNADWENDLADFLQKARFVLITVVIDKHGQRERHHEDAWHPYHYCADVLFERLLGCLRFQQGKADVMAEKRGANEDRLLEAEYRKVWLHGTDRQTADEFRQVLTTGKLKLRWKNENIGGLQIADLLAAPSKKEILAEKGRIPPLGGYEARLVKLLQPKYNKYGRVFLP